MNKAILFSKFIKYDFLKSLILQTPSAGILTQMPVDIYIDIQSVYKQVLAENILVNDYKVLSINILNMAAHYRHFFCRHGVNTRIYIVNGKNTSDNITSQVNSQNVDMFKIIQTISPYFPLTYYIDRQSFNGSAIIMGLIQTETIPKNYASLVISNDILSYQIPALVQNAFVLRPSVNTKLVSFNNVLSYMYPRNKSVVTSDLNPALLPIIMAYHKCPELGLPMLNNFKTTIGIIRNKINNNQILNNYNSPVLFKNEHDIFTRLYLSDLMTAARSYMNSYETLIVNNWRTRKECPIDVLANTLDNAFNRDEENILNYVFLLEVSDDFIKYNK